MSIQNELDKIKNAVYGKEVRGAIHDGIKKAYDDASKNGNANMEVEMAKGKYPTLNGRLENIDQETFSLNRQLADKANSLSLEIEKKRIDGIVGLKQGSTTGDAEIMDSKVGQDGFVYDTMGNAIRTQFENAYNKLVNKKVGTNKFDKKGVHTPIHVGQYVEYNTGTRANVATLQYVEIPVKAGQKITMNVYSNFHVAFFSSPVYQKSSYISGVLSASTYTVPANAIMMTVSFKPEFNNALQIEAGTKSTIYEPFEYGVDSVDIKNEAVKINHLSAELRASIGRREIHVGKGYPYTSILKAMKENYKENVTFFIHSGIYDIEKEYKEVYGINYFQNYSGYQTADVFDRGLFMADGVELIGIGNVELVFNYSGGNPLVHKWFAPISNSQNNKVYDIHLAIADGVCRYGIHDDFATKEGTNEFVRCSSKGKSFLNTFVGGGFGLSNTYIFEDCNFEEPNGISIAYHNNVAAKAKNKLIIKNTFCAGSIRGASYGASTDKSIMMVSGCKALSISVVLTDDTGNNQNNIELKQWNNEIG